MLSPLRCYLIQTPFLRHLSQYKHCKHQSVTALNPHSAHHLVFLNPHLCLSSHLPESPCCLKPLPVTLRQSSFFHSVSPLSFLPFLTPPSYPPPHTITQNHLWGDHLTSHLLVFLMFFFHGTFLFPHQTLSTQINPCSAFKAILRH